MLFPIRALRARILVWAALSWCLLPAVFPNAEDAVKAAILGLQQRYAAVSSVTASFVQTYQAPGMNQTESGALWMKKPGLMYWEYRTPETKLFYADGRKTYLYVPEDHQVMVRSFTEADLRSTPLEFLLGKGDILHSYRAVQETETRRAGEGTIMVKLVPIVTEVEYSFLVLEIDRVTFDLRRIVIHERTGNLSEFLFTDVHTNVRINDTRFRFQIPKGVEVIELDEK